MLALSNGARTGLTGFAAGLARSIAEHNVTLNNLLPGTFDTDRLKSNLAALTNNSSRDVTEVTEEIRTGNPARRFGHPDEFVTCAFLCSAHAGYITGQKHPDRQRRLSRHDLIPLNTRMAAASCS